MKLFRPYPLLVTKEGQSFEILEYDLIPLNEFDCLIIKDKQHPSTIHATLSHQELKNATIPSEWGLVTFEYYLNENLVSSHSHDLTQTYERYEFKREVFDSFEDLLFLVREEMDSPKGTIEENAHHTRMLNRCVVEDGARQFVMAKIKNILIRHHAVKPEEIDTQAYSIFSALYGLGPIQVLDDDDTIEEIMVNAYEFPHFHCDIYYIQDHIKKRHTQNFENIKEVERVFNNCVAFENRQLNAVDNYHIEANRPNKDRVNILIPPATESWALNIRKFSCFVPDKESMLKVGTVDEWMLDLFEVLVTGKANIGVGGPMGTGKTTLLNFLLTYTQPEERKMIISSVSETDIDRVLAGHDIIIGKVANDRGITFAKLLEASLRTTSSRVIIPESRGSEFKEVFEANLKTKGNMFTAHAIEASGFMEACVDMYLSNPNVSGESAEAIRNKLTSGIDIIIMMRLAGDKIRIKSISEVVADENGNFDQLSTLYEFAFDPENPSEGHYRRTENRMTDKLKKRLNEMGVPISKMADL